MTLFADLVGFTAMTESFSRSGSVGTEQLTRVVNDWFGVTAEAIARSGGSVVDFAGDALVGMFRYTPESAGDVARRAIRCAELIREATAAADPVETPDGSRALTVRIGLAGGPLLVMLLGDPRIRVQHLIAGPALDAATAAVQRAGHGEIVVDPQLVTQARQEGSPPPEEPVRQRSADLEQPLEEPVRQSSADLEQLLTPFLHPAIRDRLRSGRHEFVSEHRKVTTAFVRLPDLSADDPASVRALQDCLAAGVAVIDRYGGHLRHLMADDKGTVLVALFGTPVSNEDDEERAVRCCLELLALPGGPYRGGMTTGPVYSGEVGSDVRREYAAVGDAVNLAARLMQAAPPGRLLIDTATYERVRDVVVAEGPATVVAKGKAEPVPAWSVREALDAPPVTALPDASDPPVGRTGELDLMRAVVRRTLAGHGQVVWVHGEAGIGKSRLAAEACRIAGEAGFTGHAGSCRSHGSNAGYVVWRTIWREMFGIAGDRPVEEQQAALTRLVARHDGSGERAPVLAPLLNLPMPETRLTAQLDAAGRDVLLRATLLSYLRDRTAAGPLVLLLEDCQWIDPASLALLDALARQIAGLPVLILVTSREPVAQRLSDLPHLSGLALEQLPPADAGRLAMTRLRERYGRDSAIEPQVVDAIVTQAGGNAFYVEELVSYLQGQGIDPGDPAALTRAALPDSLQRLVMARIDQLSDGEQITTKVASVIGRRFLPPWIPPVYPAAGTLGQVYGHLRRLNERDVIRPLPAEAAPRHEFKHPVTQEAAYRSITHRTRAALHERVAELIETLHADRLPQYADVLAHHYGRTDRVDKQRTWFRAAGDHARSTFANEAAVHYYERLLPLLDRSERAELHVQLGTVHQHIGAWAEAEEHYRRALREAGATDRPDIVAAGQRHLGDLLMYTHSYAESVSWLTRALAGFERLGDTAGLARTMDRLTYALYRRGSYDAARALAHRHLALSDERQDANGMSTAHNHLGLILVSTGRLDEALEHLRLSSSIAQEADDRQAMLNAALNLGWALVRRTDHIAAMDSYRDALTAAQEMGARHTASVAVGNMSVLYWAAGEIEPARTCALHALQEAVEVGSAPSISVQLDNLGAIAAAQGRPGEARRLLGRAIAMARAQEAPRHLCEWLQQLAAVEMAAGRTQEAERLNSEALRIAEEHEERVTHVLAFALSVRLRVDAGRIDAGTGAGLLRDAARRWSEPRELAVLLDGAWQLDPADEESRVTAARAYRALVERAPNLAYAEAYERLTGEPLPPGPRLPGLPAWLAEEPAPDLEVLLRRIDGSAHLGGAA